MTKTLISLVLALLGFNATAQDFRGIASQVFQGVAQNTIIGIGDSGECGVQAKINAAIAKSISRGSYYANSGDLQTCLNQKRYERERLQQQALMERQQWLQRQQQLEDEARRRQQQFEDEARRMAPKCSYSTHEVIKGGVAAPKEESRDCNGQRYEDFIRHMTLK